MANVEDIIRKNALINAYKYEKADFKAVISKVIAEVPEIKKNLKEYVPKIKEIIEEVNKMSYNEIKRIVEEKYAEIIHAKKEEKKDLDELPNAEYGKVRTRIPPEPNGYLHIGHGLSFTLNYLYAKKYDGSVVLKFEDTNPLKEKPEFYAAIMREIRNLGIEWDELYIISEHFDELEKAAIKLIKDGKAYVSTLKDEEIKRRRMNKEPDPCREQSIEENLELWDEMKAGAKYVLRWKGDYKADNAVLRDPVFYRVIDEVHPWTLENHVVYPTYDFANAYTDGFLKITHVLRSEEFLQRAELHKQVMQALGFKPPIYIHYGRFQLEGAPTSKRKIRPLVEQGIVSGWDDPRLSTLIAFRRRGILPETIKELAKSVGMHRGKALITWDLLLGINRKFVDKKAERYFAIENPIKLKIEGPEKIAKIPISPYENKGFRELEVYEGINIYIDRKDYESLQNKVFRLKDLYNVKIDGNKLVYVGDELIKPIIHWLPEDRTIKGEIIIPGILFNGDEINKDSLQIKKLLVEDNVLGNKNNIVQFERLYFARLEKKDPLKMVKISD